LIANAPVRSGKVNSFLLRAAAGECSSVGSPAVCWLKRLGFPRAGAVDQPYFMPLVVVFGRMEDGKRKVGGNWMAPQFVGSLGAIVL
jgi:hypothetical protein